MYYYSIQVGEQFSNVSLVEVSFQLGIWAVDALRPLVTLIKYIDFRVFRDSGGIWVGAQQKSHMGS